MGGRAKRAFRGGAETGIEEPCEAPPKAPKHRVYGRGTPFGAFLESARAKIIIPMSLPSGPKRFLISATVFILTITLLTFSDAQTYHLPFSLEWYPPLFFQTKFLLGRPLKDREIKTVIYLEMEIPGFRGNS